MAVSGTPELHPPGRILSVRASEAELICGAIGRLASGPLAEATVAALRVAGREAEAGGSAWATFRLEAPDHGEHLVMRAAIMVRGRLVVGA